jgi:hypothetical protein
MHVGSNNNVVGTETAHIHQETHQQEIQTYQES